MYIPYAIADIILACQPSDHNTPMLCIRLCLLGARALHSNKCCTSMQCSRKADHVTKSLYCAELSAVARIPGRRLLRCQKVNFVRATVMPWSTA